MDRAAAALSLIAFGVTAFGAALPHFFGARAREIRWVTALSAGVALWLAAQSYGFLTGSWQVSAAFLNVLASLLGGVFLAFALLPPRGETARRSWIALAVGVAMVPVAMANHFRLPGTKITAAALLVWHLIAWGFGAWLLTRNTMRRTAGAPRAERMLARGVVVGLGGIVPIILVGSFINSRVTYGYLFPLLMIVLQFLLVTGIARLRFYDIEVRAIRAGELAAEASDADRMAVLGELTATLAHEIRNPMTGIRSLAQRLSTEETDVATSRSYADVIVRESERIENLVSTLLGAARRAPRTRTPIDLDALFDDVRLLVEPRARRKGVRIAVEPAAASVVAPRDALLQTLLNLVINAVSQSPEGGIVRLKATSVEGMTSMSVDDEGPGLDDASEIWKPFHSGMGGHGIGLAVVERTARSEGWQVRAENRERGGARFSVSIPEAR